MLLSVDAINVGMERLASEDFYVPAHAAVFEAIYDLFNGGQPVDAVTVADALRRKDELERVGGLGFLTTLSTAVPTAANVEYYASIVSEESVRRRLLAAGGDIGQLATSTDRDIDWVIDEAEQTVFRVAERRVGDTLQPISSFIDPTLEKIEEFGNRGGGLVGLPTGFRDLDDRLSGLQPENFLVIASRPGMGKSALAMNIARNVALNDGVVAVFSLEMSQEEIIQRLICSTARIDNGLLRSGRLGAEQWPRVLEAAGKMDQAPLYIDDSSYLTVTDVRAKCRRLQRRHALDLVVIDYLQLMQGRSRENRQQEIAEISRGLKNLARELRVPIIALSQLNRALEARTDKRPQLGDLRECLTADTRIQRSDDGSTITIGEIAREGLTNVPVYSLDDEHRLVPSVMAEAWSTGEKEVFRVTTASGRTVRASANHPFFCRSGWTTVERLRVGAEIAVMPEAATQRPKDGWTGGAVSVLARVDVAWDSIVSIESDGIEETFDAVVPGTHNFVADDIVVHNSGAIEQDSDIVLFIYRDEYYNPESEQRGTAEILVAKHRAGSTGRIYMSFAPAFTAFGDLARAASI